MTRDEIFDVIVAAADKRVRGESRRYVSVVDAAAVVADILADDDLVINVAKDFAPGEHFCESDAQHCVARGAAIIGFKNAVIGKLKEAAK